MTIFYYVHCSSTVSTVHSFGPCLNPADKKIYGFSAGCKPRGILTTTQCKPGNISFTAKTPWFFQRGIKPTRYKRW
jgi:hypothetical protein